MNDTKGLLTSKTFWGVVITVSAAVAPKVFGYSVDEALAMELVDETIMIIGGIFAIYGRVSADKIITKL
jgi:hypothetical protein